MDRWKRCWIHYLGDCDCDDIARNDALRALAEVCPRQAEIVKLVYRDRLFPTEVAEKLGISREAVREDAVKATVWLNHRMALGNLFDETRLTPLTSRRTEQLRRFAERFFSPKTNTLVLRPTLEDLELEYREAVAAGRLWQARWVWYRGCWSFGAAIAAHLLRSCGRSPQSVAI